MASAPAPAPAPERTAPTLPDEILEDIFLRLHEAADLARASAVCSSFRRAARDRGFLRRFRSLHPPPILGVLDSWQNHGVFLHAEPPHRFVPAARALAQAADFNFSFVPKPREPSYSSTSHWRVWDALDGRVLLSMNRYTNIAFEDLVVCDPLHRRYVQIPPIPADLVPSNRCHGDHLDFEHFLAPSSAEDQEKDELSFQVICNVRSTFKVVTLAFSSVTANWRGATSISFLPDRLIHDIRTFARYYVRGCFYWAGGTDGSFTFMLVLDSREMQLTVVNLQFPGPRSTRTAIVDAGEDKLGMVSIGVRMGTLDFYCKTWWNNDDGAEDWDKKIIRLPELSYCWFIVGAADGHLLLLFNRNVPSVYYLLELKILLFERLHVSDMGTSRFFASSPPPFSLPTTRNVDTLIWMEVITQMAISLVPTFSDDRARHPPCFWQRWGISISLPTLMQ